jgi:threonine dehydratase
MERPLVPSLAEIEAARDCLLGIATWTPLVKLHLPESPREIYLKLENLQPAGSFKIRGAGNALARLDPRPTGVLTASAGNMAQGVALGARRLGVPCTVIAPESAAKTKLDAAEALGARVIRVSFDRWWQTFVERRYPGIEGTFVHAFDDVHVMAGNGTIGLEILEDLPEVERVYVPWGGGGLTTGIAAALDSVKPGVEIVAVEIETGAPLGPSLALGTPQTVDHTRSFVDGIGSRTVLPSMLERARGLVDRTLTVGLQEVADAVRLLVERQRVVAEGAGAASLAAALREAPPEGPVVCVVSGGNIDTSVLQRILEGAVPR